MSKFKERFKALRTSQGIRQVDVASHLGITPQAVSNYASGREPDYDTLISLAELFGVSVDYLIGATNSRNEQTEGFCNKTGLSDEAVDTLIAITEGYPHGECRISEVLSNIICSPVFFDFILEFSKLSDARFINIAAELLFDSRLPNIFVSENYGDDTFAQETENNINFVLAALEKHSCDTMIMLADSIRQSQKITKSEIKKALRELIDEFG